MVKVLPWADRSVWQNWQPQSFDENSTGFNHRFPSEIDVPGLARFVQFEPVWKWWPLCGMAFWWRVLVPRHRGWRQLRSTGWDCNTCPILCNKDSWSSNFCWFYPILIFSDFSSWILLVVMPASRLPHSVLGWFSPVVTGKFQDCLIISLSLGAPRCFELKVRVLALPRFWVFERWTPRLMIWLPYGKTWNHTILNMHMVYKSVLLSIHYTCAISYIVMLNNQRVPANMSRRTWGWFPARRCASRRRCSVWCCMEDGLAGWLISWKILLWMDDNWGTIILGNLQMISNAHRHQNGGHDPPKMLGDVQNLRIPG